MKITVHNDDGNPEEIDFVPEDLSMDELHYFTQMRYPWAIEEMKKRIGLDPYKPDSEITMEDLDYHDQWEKNQLSETSSNIEKKVD